MSSGESGESVKGGSGRGAHHVVGAGERRERIAQYPRPKLAHGLVGADQVGRPRAGAHPAEHLTAHSKCEGAETTSSDEKCLCREMRKEMLAFIASYEPPRFTSASRSAAGSSASPSSTRPLFAAFFLKSLKHFLSWAQNLSTSSRVVPSAAAAVK